MIFPRLKSPFRRFVRVVLSLNKTYSKQITCKTEMKTHAHDESQPEMQNAAPLAAAASPGASADEWPLVIEGGDSIQPSTSADSLGHLALPFTVPAAPVDPATQQTQPRKAMIALSLGGEDWGEAWISRNGSEEKLAHIDLLCSDDNPAGKLGGHAYQTGASNVELESGEYTLHIVQSNIDMENPAYNISIWN